MSPQTLPPPPDGTSSEPANKTASSQVTSRGKTTRSRGKQGPGRGGKKVEVESRLTTQHKFVSPRPKWENDIAAISSQLAIMVRSGVDLASALATLAKQCKVRELKQMLEKVGRELTAGKSFSEAISNFEEVFGTTYITTVAAGEATGQMAEVLSQLSSMLRSHLKLKNRIRALMAYPILLTTVSCLVIMGLLVFVLPQFAKIFAEYETPLPMLTQALLGIAGVLVNYWWLVLPGAAAMVAGSLFLIRSESGRTLLDRLSLSLPILKEVVQAMLIGRVCRLLSLMIKSGVPLLEGIQIVQAATGNRLYARMFASMEKDILNGRGIANALLAHEFIPGTAAQMIITAERTGSLGEVTELIGEHFEEDGETRIRELVAYLEPTITIVMGVIVAIVVLAVMLPMFDLATFAGR